MKKNLVALMLVMAIGVSHASTVEITNKTPYKLEVELVRVGLPIVKGSVAANSKNDFNLGVACVNQVSASVKVGDKKQPVTINGEWHTPVAFCGKQEKFQVMMKQSGQALTVSNVTK
jgi:hypothetical protein